MQVVMQVVSKSLNSSGRPRAAPGEANCHCHELNGSCGEGLFVTIPALADPEGDDIGENARVGGQKEFERCNRHGRDSSMIESECPAHNRQRFGFRRMWGWAVGCPGTMNRMPAPAFRRPII